MISREYHFEWCFDFKKKTTFIIEKMRKNEKENKKTPRKFTNESRNKNTNIINVYNNRCLLIITIVKSSGGCWFCIKSVRDLIFWAIAYRFCVYIYIYIRFNIRVLMNFVQFYSKINPPSIEQFRCNPS